MGRMRKEGRLNLSYSIPSTWNQKAKPWAWNFEADVPTPKVGGRSWEGGTSGAVTAYIIIQWGFIWNLFWEEGTRADLELTYTSFLPFIYRIIGPHSVRILDSYQWSVIVQHHVITKDAQQHILWRTQESKNLSSLPNLHAQLHQVIFGAFRPVPLATQFSGCVWFLDIWPSMMISLSFFFDSRATAEQTYILVLSRRLETILA